MWCWGCRSGEQRRAWALELSLKEVGESAVGELGDSDFEFDSELEPLLVVVLGSSKDCWLLLHVSTCR